MSATKGSSSLLNRDFVLPQEELYTFNQTFDYTGAARLHRRKIRPHIACYDPVFLSAPRFLVCLDTGHQRFGWYAPAV
jgi:hypothetical protein